jgi:hypothetical protein
MLISLAIWVQNLPYFTDLRSSGYTYPFLLALHLVFISLFGGMILVTDLRILGWAMRSYPIADVINRLRVPKRIGFVLAATCGFLLFCSKAEAYYYNAFFQTKLTLFALVAIHALIFRGSVYNKAAALDATPSQLGRARTAAWLSLLLWTCILIAGRGIGYLTTPSGMHFAGLRAPFTSAL